MSIYYTKSAGVNDAQIGKLETPIKMVIEHESDIQTKKGGICDWLFNVEKSGKFGETIVGQNEFDVFSATEEGAGAENDTIVEHNSNPVVQPGDDPVLTPEITPSAEPAPATNEGQMNAADSF